MFTLTEMTLGRTSVLVVAVLVVAGGVAPAVFAAETDADAEPDDDRASATALATNETVEGTIVEGDEDWYAVEVQAGETILPTLTLREDPDSHGLRIDVYNASGDLIQAYPNDLLKGDPYRAGGENAAFDDEARGAAVAEETGTYYVRVSGQETLDLSPTGRYDLTVRTATLDEYEPNQRQATAVPIAENETVTATMATYDPDWYRFDATAGQTIRLNVTFPDPTDVFNEMTLTVYDPDGQVIAQEDTIGLSGPVAISVTAPATGTYHVAIEQGDVNSNLFGSGTYEMTVNVSSTDGGADDADTDGDGYADGTEVDSCGSDPLDPADP